MTRRLWIAAALGWTIAIVAACTIPGTAVPSASLWEYDKLGHFAFFAVFGWLWLRAFAGHRAAWALVLGGGIAFAVGTEVYQGLLPWPRSPDVWDALADTAGVAVAVAASRMRRREQLSA